jgi:peptidoglycan endopeptidase LytE
MDWCESVREITAQGNPHIQSPSTNPAGRKGAVSVNRLAKLFLSAALVTVAGPSVSFAATAHTYGQKQGVKNAPSHAIVREEFSDIHFTTNQQRTTTYIVKSGDTLWGIATRFHTTVSDLASLNHLNSKAILKVGQHLKMPLSQRTSSRSGSGLLSMAIDLKGQLVAQYARTFVGAPYQWAGTTPNGFDCSGLVFYVYRHFGFSLPRSSYGMYGIGSPVRSNDLAPGDLVFFNTDGPGASHVGIFLGGGQFISAERNGVNIASLFDSYWGLHYLGARDVLH